MLTYEDCVAMSELTAEEVDAIAEHEHIPAMIALEMGRHLLNEAGGRERVQRFIMDGIESAHARGDSVRAACLRLTLQGFRKRGEALAA